MSADSQRPPDQSNGHRPAKYRSRTHLQAVSFSVVWTIDNFDSVASTKTILQSEGFPDAYENDAVNWDETRWDSRWELILYPKGSSPDNPDYMSVFLKLIWSDKPNERATFSFSLLDDEDQQKFIMTESNIHEFSPDSDWGFETFAKLSEIRKPHLKLLEDNRLKIQCDLHMVGDPCSKSAKCARFELKRPDYRLLGDMEKTFESRKFCDVDLVGCDGVELPAHKFILTARSEVFASMFDHQMKEKIQNRVEIADVSSDVLREVLRYLYTGKTPEMPDMVNDLLFVADKYALYGLKERCEEFLLRNLTLDSAAEVYILADTHNAEQLKTFIRDFICNRAVDFLEKPGWENLLAGHPVLANEIAKAIALRTCGPPRKKTKRSTGSSRV